MLSQRGNQSGRASSAASRRGGDSAEDRMGGVRAKSGRASSAKRIGAGDTVREEEQDKQRIEQLKVSNQMSKSNTLFLF